MKILHSVRPVAYQSLYTVSCCYSNQQVLNAELKTYSMNEMRASFRYFEFTSHTHVRADVIYNLPPHVWPVQFN